MAEANSVSSASDLKPGVKLTGTVRQAALSGAVVDLGLDLDGWIHISQLKEGRVNNVSDVVSDGQEVSAWVRRVDGKAGRVDLTLIEPVEDSTTEMAVGEIVKGKVVRLEKYGAFVDVGAARPGMIHVSELADGFVKSPEDIVKIGEEVEARVIAVNLKKGRIDLSLKEDLASFVEDEPEDEEEQVTAFALAYQRALDKDSSGDTSGAEDEGPHPVDSKRKQQAELLARTLEQHKNRDE